MSREKHETNKYETHVRPKFKYIEEALKGGSTEEETAKAIGISYASWKNYKKAHKEFSGLIVSAKQESDLPVISALYQAAVGGQIVKEHKVVTKNGETEEYTIEKEMAPNIDAAKFWLTNRRPKDFKNKQAAIVEAEIVDKLEEFIV